MSEWESIEAEKVELMRRALLIQKAEIERDKEYADKKKILDDELFTIRRKQETDLESKRVSRLGAIEKEVTSERESRIVALEKELSEKLKLHESSLQKAKDSLDEKRNALIQAQAQLDDMKEELEYQKHRLQSRKDTLDEREQNLNSEIDVKVEERKKSFEHDKAALKDECACLRESIKTSHGLIANFDELKHKLGSEDPATVLLKLRTYEEEIKDLRDELAIRPTQEMQESFDRIKSEKEAMQLACERFSEENESLRVSARMQSELEMQIAELEVEKKSYKQRFESVDADNNRLMEELKRLQASYEREQDREARIRDIEAPFINKELPRSEKLKSEVEKFFELRKNKEKNKDNQLADDEEIEFCKYEKVIGGEEIQWLNKINASCIDYGFKFPRRILHAFHTALKTSEWSPLTVLAGVSGTGKSELPRLYSHFGGVNFLSLSVQPNWDSQESMLGFFNSIDNKFDAQPVLRLLAQSQKSKSGTYPGLKDVMSLILLDEMNLAHVELYFAEFLSKLELRRGMKSDLPFLDVKLGAGIQPYQLPLGRNVLWAGTMNQDETTKSLSDKVLDRGIVINFPRPTMLERRMKLKPLGEQAPLLSRKLWESWWCSESKFKDDQILPFKDFVQEMNASLSTVGRALGHRVWQSIEYYMCNYPDVIEAQRNENDDDLAKAMKIAFEDQLVQKVMPKLRGIETRGSKSDCLDKIKAQISLGIKDGKNFKANPNAKGGFSIGQDFKLACEMGYGQFIWSSANYLKDDDQDSSRESAENK